MIAKGLKQYAEEKGFKLLNTGMYGSVYGVLDGFMVTIAEGNNVKIASFSCAVTDDAAGKIQMKLSDKAFRKEYKIFQFEVQRESVSIAFTDTVGTMKRISAAMEILPSILRECGVIGDGFCTACGNNIEPMQESNVVLINGIAHRVHSACAQNLDMRAEIEKNDYETEQKNIGKGVLGALLGAALGGIVWGVVYYIGYFASIIGVLIAFLAKKGYELLGGKMCKAKVFIILFAAIFGVVLGQVGVYWVMLYIEGIQYGYTLLDIPFLFIEILKADAEYARAFLADMAGGLFFGVLGAIGTVLTSNKEHKNATIKSQILE